MTQEQERKEKALGILRRRYEGQRQQVEGVEPRLAQYYDDLIAHSSAVEGDGNDWHNYYEVLGAIKFLRLLRTYEFDMRKVQRVVKMREGTWKRDGRMWRHVGGGLKCPGTSGAQVYRWEPFQVFILASIFGFHAWIDTQLTTYDRQTLLPTERVEDDRIMDLRRLCTDFTCFMPRKSDKTGMSAFIQCWFFFFEDDNSEIYCAANSADQSRLLFRRTKLMLSQIDDGHRIRQTETVCDWRPNYKHVHDSSIRPLSAGGKAKDGMFAQLCCADEYGSAAYINNKADMKMLVDVVQSSMGPRREPLTMTTTTAGRVMQGPFIDKLDGLHRLLEKEIDFEEGVEQPSLGSDRTLCLCLEPDQWERDDEYLLSNKTVRRKVNPMLGKIVQHQFYDDEIAKARMDGDTAEVITKLFNVYQSNTTKEWIKPDEIRGLQIERRIDDCTAEKGWIVFGGFDFSKGNDLNGAGYLAVNLRTREYFADTDLWISQKAVEESTVRELYEKWADEGWLNIVPGKTFDPAVVVNRIAQLTRGGVDFWRFGYDPYNAAIVMNALAAYIHDLGKEPKDYIKVVRQNYATYNGVVKEFDYFVHRSTPDGKPWPLVHFSRNPMLPWQFGNCMLDVDKFENEKPVKRNRGSSACKVDSVQMILSALWLYDQVDGNRVEEDT